MDRKMDEQGVKEERMSPSSLNRQMPAADHGHLDYSRLYGDLCRKLLNTPVTEFMSPTNKPTYNDVPSGIPMSDIFSSNDVPLQSPGHDIGSPLSQLSNNQSPFGGMYHQTGVFDVTEQSKEMAQMDGPKMQRQSSDIDMDISDYYSPSMDLIAESHSPIDIQRLVDEFRVTLERYGVSQRFAARFIMQDTSQGNLSFLMEKGRVKKWDELSPRGRIPYIKMKAWLDNKDQQMNVLNMLKFAHGVKKSPRDCYNRRERFSMFQLHVLCRLFEENQTPPMNVRTAVAERLNIPLDRINVWFQNQRARGFPARKILQQHAGLFSEDLQEGFKAEIQAAKEISMLAKGMCSSPSASNTASPTLSRHDVPFNLQPMKIEPRDSIPKWVAPVQSSTNGMGKSPEMTSKKPAHFHEKPLDLSSIKTEGEISPNCSSNVTSDVTSAAEKVTGASKRKRGSKPQQIIPRAETNQNKGNGSNENDGSAKRRRLSTHAKFDHPLEVTCAEQTEYNYVLTKSEPDDADEFGTKVNHKTKDERLQKEDKTCCITDENITGEYLLKVKSDTDQCNEQSSEQKDLLLKAMCASIVKQSNTNGHASILEPDLD